MKNILTLFGKTLLVILTVFSVSSVAKADVALSVTGVTAEKVSGVPDGTYANGWRWVFHVTLPEKENLVKMKFDNFSNGSFTIPVANNLRLYSTQSTTSPDGNSAITITAPLVYSDALVIATSTDLNPGLAGVQADIVVEMKIPVGTVGSGYTTSYGIVSSELIHTPVAPVVYPENSIVSGLCLTINPNNWIHGGGHITSGIIYKYGKENNFPALDMTQFSPSLLSNGLEWLLYVNASSTNGYHMTTSPEFRTPELIAKQTLVGKITYNILGEITHMESANPGCDPVTITPVEEIQSGMCVVPVDATNFKITAGTVLFDGVARQFPERPMNISQDLLDKYSHDWTIFTNYNAHENSFNVHTSSGLSHPVFGPNPKEVYIGLVRYSNDGKVLSLKSQNVACESYTAPTDPVPPANTDTVKPVITMQGPLEVNLKINTPYSDPLATASDDVDGDITAKLIYSGVVDPTNAGDYTRTINVSDSAGNAADPVSQIVHVIPLDPIENTLYELNIDIGSFQFWVDHVFVVGNDPGQYPALPIANLVSALDHARAVVANPASTLVDLQNEKANLFNAWSAAAMSVNP